MSNTYYYLKLPEDFFDKHYIKIIKKLQNGNDYLLFLLKLYVESVPHSATLRFSDEMPYTNEMLADITDTNIEIVDQAMELFKQLGVVEIMKDQTIWLPMADKLIGKETDAAKRMRERRETLKNKDCSAFVQKCSKVFENVQKCYTILDIDIDIKLDIDLNINLNNVVASSNDNIETLAELTDLNISLIIKEWNERSLTTNISSIKPLTKRYDNTRRCIGNNFQSFLNTIKSIDDQAYFKKRSKISYDWFVNIDNYQKVAEGNYLEDYKLKNQFNNFDQRTYNFDELENKLFS